MPNLRPLSSTIGNLVLANPTDLRDTLKLTTKQRARTLYGRPQTQNQADWRFNWSVDLTPCNPTETCKVGVEKDAIHIFVSHSLETKEQMAARLSYALTVVASTKQDMLNGFTPVDPIPAFVPVIPPEGVGVQQFIGQQLSDGQSLSPEMLNALLHDYMSSNNQ